MNIAQAQAKFLKSSIDQMLGVDKGDMQKVGGMDNMMTKYASNFLTKAADNLNKVNAISTGKLEESMTFNVIKSSNKVTINFEALDYYKFVDKGVRGSGASRKNSTSPYKYKDKQPPVAVIEKWIIKNRLVAKASDVGKYGRTKRETKAIPIDKGRRDLAFLIARAIKRDGLYATNFWQDAFDDTFNNFAVDMSRALGRTISVNLQQMADEFKSKQGTQIPR